MYNPFAQQQRQQKAVQREWTAQMRRQAREAQSYMREVSKAQERAAKFPKLSDKVVKLSLTHEIYQQYMANGVQVPEPSVLCNMLKWRRVKAIAPEPYTIADELSVPGLPQTGQPQRLQAIKHACKANGVSFNKIRAGRIIFHNPNGVIYNHDYNFVVPYFYCPKCKAVIYYYLGEE